MKGADNKAYYAMRYCSKDKGCPVVLSGLFNCDQFEWDSFEPNPLAIEVRQRYVLELSSLDVELNDLNFDFYQLGDIYVSRRFLAVCDELGAKYKAIPLEILYKGEFRKHDYFIFLPGESLAALDKAESVFEISKELETDREIGSPIYPGALSIDNISSFVILPALDSDIFRCQETLELFCSEKFKAAACGLKGVRFEMIDESYKYDTWAEFNEI